MEKSDGTEVLKANIHLITPMLGDIRKEDSDEAFAMTGKLAEDCLIEGVDKSDISYVGLYHGDPVVCFGVRRNTSLSNKGIVWLLSTNKLNSIKNIFIRNSRPYVVKLMNGFDMLENWVDVRNTVAIRWLRWCGFKFDETPKPVGCFGDPFYHFSLRKEDMICA